MKRRIRAVAGGLLGMLAACHESRIVHIEVFENYVSVEGVRSDASIQQAADSQTAEHKGNVLLVPRPPLSAARLEELKRCMDKLYPADPGSADPRRGGD